MTNKIQNIVLLGGAMLLFVSCAKDEYLKQDGGSNDKVEYNPTDGIPRVDRKLTFSSEWADESQTRTQFEDRNSTKLVWLETDKVGIFPIAKTSASSTIPPTKANNTKHTEAALISGAGSSAAKFDGVGNVASLSDYCFYYPYQADAAWKSGDASTISVHNSPRERVQNGFSQNGKDGNDRIGDYAFATCLKQNVPLLLDTDAPQVIALGKLKHHVAYIEVPLDNLVNNAPVHSYANNKVDSVEFHVLKNTPITAGQNLRLWGASEIDWSTQTLNVSVSAADEKYRTIVLKCLNMTLPANPVSDIGGLSVFFTTYPVTGADQYGVKVYMTKEDGVTKEVYNFTSKYTTDKTYEFKAGQKYQLRISDHDDADVLDFTGNYGRNAYIYYGDQDKENDFKGNGWVDDPNSGDLQLKCFEFIANRDLTITAPDTKTDVMYADETSITEWKGKTYGEIADKTVTLSKGTKVNLVFKLGKGEFEYKWDIKRGDNNQLSSLSLIRKSRVSYLGKEKFITYYKKINITDKIGTNLVAETSDLSGKKYIDVKLNTTVTPNATHATLDSDMGFKATELSLYDHNNIRSYYYVSQVGLGFSSKLIKLAKPKAAVQDDDWVFYIPVGDYDANGVPLNSKDKAFVEKIDQSSLLFIMGRREGLRIPDNAPEGVYWDDLDNRYSYTREEKEGNAVKNSYGFYYRKNVKYSDFKFNEGTTDSPCEDVFPFGAWRRPTNDEVRNWKTDGSEYPIIESYPWLKMQLGSGLPTYVDIPIYISVGGKHGGGGSNTIRKIVGILVGTLYFKASNMKYDEPWFSEYPIKWIENGFADENEGLSAPTGDIALGYSWKQACGILCIRK